MRVFLLTFFFILALGSVGLLGLLEFWSGQPGSALSEQIFEIKRGENAWAVAKNLEDTRIIRSRFGFLYALARLKKLDGGMVAG